MAARDAVWLDRIAPAMWSECGERVYQAWKAENHRPKRKRFLLVLARARKAVGDGGDDVADEG